QALLAFALTLSLFAFASAAPGDLDPTFGDGGKVITDMPGDNFAKQVEIQPDGKIVALVNGYLIRYNSNGKLDNSFGTSGVLNSSLFGAYFGDGFAILPDGKFLIVGAVIHPALANLASAVFRFNPNGTPDTTWGVNGVVSTLILGADSGNKVLVQPDGKIITFVFSCCHAAYPPDPGFSTVIRYHADGTLDSAFGSGGFVSISDARNAGGAVRQAELQADGKILFLNHNGQTASIGRLNANGTLDTTFIPNSFEPEGGFIQIYTNRVSGNTFALQSDGKIIVAATATDSRGITTSRLLRFTANGGYDSFGTNGSAAIAPQTNRYFELNSVFVQPDDKIIAGGAIITNSSRSFVLFRFYRYGEIETGFGTGGFATATLRGVNDHLTALAIQPDGTKVVALGEIAISLTEPYKIGLARFLLTTRRPKRFGFDEDSKANRAFFRD
ncbi:MAG TPA: hypothetical protein VK892_12090, partial [Pyrinomonadaceae bacterium]|nr:hypothetical protein [Pyrinomonadaceae bacterium]